MDQDDLDIILMDETDLTTRALLLALGTFRNESEDESEGGSEES